MRPNTVVLHMRAGRSRPIVGRRRATGLRRDRCGGPHARPDCRRVRRGHGDEQYGAVGHADRNGARHMDQGGPRGRTARRGARLVAAAGAGDAPGRGGGPDRDSHGTGGGLRGGRAGRAPGQRQGGRDRQARRDRCRDGDGDGVARSDRGHHPRDRRPGVLRGRDVRLPERRQPAGHPPRLGRRADPEGCGTPGGCPSGCPMFP